MWTGPEKHSGPGSHFNAVNDNNRHPFRMKKPFSAAEMDELKKIIKEANGKIFDPLKEIDVIV